MKYLGLMDSLFDNQYNDYVCHKCKITLNENTSIYGIELYYSQDDDFPKDIVQFCWSCYKKNKKCQNPIAYLLTMEFEPSMSRLKIQKILHTKELLFDWFA